MTHHDPQRDTDIFATGYRGDNEQPDELKNVDDDDEQEPSLSTRLRKPLVALVVLVIAAIVIYTSTNSQGYLLSPDFTGDGEPGVEAAVRLGVLALLLP